MSTYTPEICDNCNIFMERTEVLYCEWMECSVQFHKCPECGEEYQETLE